MSKILKNSEIRYQCLIDNILDVIAELDLGGTFTYVSPQVYGIFGYYPEEIIGVKFLKFIHPNDMSILKEIMKKTIKSKDTISIEFKVRHKAGYYVSVSMRGNLVNIDGKNKFIGVLKDITERKKLENDLRALNEELEDRIEAKTKELKHTIKKLEHLISERKKSEQKLKESEEKYRSLIDGLTRVGIVIDIISNDFKILYQNQFLTERYGDLTGKICYEKYMEFKKPCDFCPMVNAIQTNIIEREEIITPDGKTYELILAPFPNPDGTIDKVSEVILDITDRKKVEQKLKESEEQLRLERDNLKNILNSMKDGVYIVNQHYDIEYVNPILIEEFGPFEKKKCFEYFHDREEVCPWCKNQEVFAGKTVRWEWFSFKNQKIYDLVDTPLKNPDGSISKLEIFRDITEHKKSEEEVRLHSEIMINMSEGVYLIRLEDLIIVYANPRFEEMFGYDPGEMIDKYVVIVNAPTDKTPEETKNEIVGILKDKGEWHGEVLNIKKDGTPFWCYANVSLFDHPEYGRVIVSVHTDITERKKAEQALKESEKKYRMLIENAQEGIWVIDENSITSYANPRIAEMLGYSKDEMLGKELFDFMDERGISIAKSNVERRKQGIKEQHDFEFLRKNGTKIYTSIETSPITDEEGNYRGAIAFVADITERKKAEEKLKESEEKYRNLVETSWMGLLELDVKKGGVIYINPRLLEIVGYTKDELKSKGMFYKAIYSDDYKKITKSDEDKDIELRLINKEGKIKWLMGRTLHHFNEQGELIYLRLWLQDITEAKELEEIKSNLLTRISHEIKTPLISIKGFTDLLLTEYRSSLNKQTISFLEKIKEGGERLKLLINRFLETAQLDKGLVILNKSYENLSILIKKVIGDVEGLISLRNHIMNVDIPDELMIYLDKEKIQSVISNLLTNAVKYTPSGGNITIKSRIKKNSLIISIRDDGIGLQKKEIAQLFKPFGKIEKYGRGWDIISEGIGLGLYLSEEIIDLHGGRIWVESQGANKGSTFYFSLPIIKK